MAGAAGKSAYQIAKEHGYNDTEENWLKSLKGERGLQGLQGPAGPAANLSEYIRKAKLNPYTLNSKHITLRYKN